MPNLIRWILVLLAAGIAIFLIIQLIPVSHENPPVVTQVNWDSPQTEELFKRSCSDCHSNETTWPWYTRVAPASWLVSHDVQEGREQFNISNLPGMRQRSLAELPEELGETVYEGEMPMPIYVLMHPQAKLNSEEQRALVEGLKRTLQLTQASR